MPSRAQNLDPEEAVSLLAHEPRLDHNIQEEEKELEHTSDRIERHAEPQRESLRVLASRTSTFFSELTPATALKLAAGVGFILLPSFIQSRIRPQPVVQTRLHPTAFLDGIRGIAALLVFFCHLVYTCHDIAHSFGANDGHGGHLTSFLMLPVLRLLYAGAPQVGYFFVVSGYALSYKPLKLMRSRSWNELFAAQVSATFRRGMRLYLPCAVSTFCVLILVRVGLYELTRDLVNNRKILWNGGEPHPWRFPTLGMQLYDWGWKMYVFVFRFKEFDYDIHLWTIPTEFIASMYLFVFQLGVAMLRPGLRLAVTGFFILVCMYSGYWVMMLFYSGFLIAELGLIRDAAAAARLQLSTPQPPQTRANRLAWNGFWVLNFLVSLYLSSQPIDGGLQTPGWRTLTSLIPASFDDVATNKWRFWTGVGAIQLVWATAHAPFLQRLFDNRAAQYLGRISFALYLVHAMCIHTVGYGAMKVFWALTGVCTPARKEAGFAAAAAVTIVCVIWAADVFWRLVDVPSVRFARWLESKARVKMA